MVGKVSKTDAHSLLEAAVSILEPVSDGADRVSRPAESHTLERQTDAIVGRILADHVRHRFQFRACVAHGDAKSRMLKHGDIVGAVAEGDGIPDGASVIPADPFDPRSLADPFGDGLPVEAGGALVEGVDNKVKVILQDLLDRQKLVSLQSSEAEFVGALPGILRVGPDGGICLDCPLQADQVGNSGIRGGAAQKGLHLRTGIDAVRRLDAAVYPKAAEHGQTLLDLLLGKQTVEEDMVSNRHKGARTGDDAVKADFQDVWRNTWQISPRTQEDPVPRGAGLTDGTPDPGSGGVWGDDQGAVDIQENQFSIHRNHTLSALRNRTEKERTKVPAFGGIPSSVPAGTQRIRQLLHRRIWQCSGLRG